MRTLPGKWFGKAMGRVSKVLEGDGLWRQVLAFIFETTTKNHLGALSVRRMPAENPHLTMVQSRHRACASSGWKAASSLYTAVESAR